jgi:hypothetical protein
MGGLPRLAALVVLALASLAAAMSTSRQHDVITKDPHHPSVSKESRVAMLSAAYDLSPEVCAACVEAQEKLIEGQQTLTHAEEELAFWMAKLNSVENATSFCHTNLAIQADKCAQLKAKAVVKHTSIESEVTDDDADGAFKVALSDWQGGQSILEVLQKWAACASDEATGAATCAGHKKEIADIMAMIVIKRSAVMVAMYNLPPMVTDEKFKCAPVKAAMGKPKSRGL